MKSAARTKATILGALVTVMTAATAVTSPAGGAIPADAGSGPGSLIGTFDGDGYVLSNIGGGINAGTAETCPTYGASDGLYAPTADTPIGAEFTDDGGLVVAGFAHHTEYQEFTGLAQSPDLFLAKYLPTGELDQTFGTGGVVILNYGTYTTVTGETDPNTECVGGLALDSQGRILVSMTHRESQRYGTIRPKLLRFTENGEADLSFDEDGWVDLPPEYTMGGDVQVTADDAAIMLTTVHVPGFSGPNQTLVRVTSEGEVDTGFNKVHTAAGSILDGIHDFAVLPTGKILTLGVRGYDEVVHRFTSTGAVDETYAVAGMFRSDLVDDLNVHFRNIAAGPDGSATILGWHLKSGGTGDDYALLRVTPSGGVDTGFSQDGYLELAPSDVDPASCLAHEYPHTVNVDAHGRALIVGQYWSACDASLGYVVYRLLADGTPDPSFSGDGKAPGAIPDPGWTCLGPYYTFLAARDAVLEPATGRFAIVSTFGSKRNCQSTNRSDVAITMMDASGSVDLPAPTGAITVQGGQPATGSRSVTLDLTATGATEMRLRNAAGTWDAWEPYSATKSWLLPDSDGSRIVEAEFRNATGNASPTYADSIVLDRVSPGPVKIQVNGGSAWTATTTVTVKVAATDPAPSSGLWQLRLRTGEGAWSAWRAHASSTSWTLPDADGAHSVQVELRDVAGNSVTAGDGIGLDRTRPVGSVKVNGGARRTSSRDVTLTLSGRDPGGSGVTKVRVRNGSGAWSAWKNYTEALSWRLPAGAGSKLVSVQYRDRAGNKSASLSDTITYKP